MLRLWNAQIEMCVALNECARDFWIAYFDLFLPSRGKRAITSVAHVESAHLGGCTVISARFGH